MVRTTEGWFIVSDGTKLYEKTWEPDTKPTAHLIALHGFSDHINAYYDLFPTLASPPFNITVHGIDQRGWGRSVHKASDRGLTGPTSQVLDDMNEYARHISSGIQDAAATPLFIFGHSMGGGQALHYLLSTSPTITKTRPPIAGLVLESPYIALDPASQPLGITVAFGKLAAKIFPKQQLKQKLDATYMSRSKQVRDDWVADKLCHDTGTMEGLRDMLQRAADLTALSEGKHVAGLSATLPCAVLWAHGTGDRVTSYATSKALFNRLEGSGKESRFYDGAYHKLHAEPDHVGEQFTKDVGEWIVKVAEATEAREGVKSKL